MDIHSLLKFQSFPLKINFINYDQKVFILLSIVTPSSLKLIVEVFSRELSNP